MYLIEGSLNLYNETDRETVFMFKGHIRPISDLLKDCIGPDTDPVYQIGASLL